MEENTSPSGYIMTAPRTLELYLQELGERLDDLPLSAPERDALVKRIAELDAEIMARAGL